MVSLKFLSRSRARKKCRHSFSATLHSDYRKDTMEKMRQKMKLLMRRLKMLKRLLKKLYQDEKTDRHDMFIKVKGKLYKNKRVLMESMHKFIRERKFASSEKRLPQGPEGGKLGQYQHPHLHLNMYGLFNSWSSVK